MTGQLTKDVVSKLTEPGTYWDNGDVKGFGIRVLSARANGEQSKTFFINYRFDGTERRFAIGHFPTWSVTAARDEAKALRRRVDRGEDPALQKRERREAPTVKDLADRYVSEHLQNKSERTQRDDKNDIEREILAELGNRLVASIQQADIEALHQKIGARGKVRANRVLSLLSRMFALSLKTKKGEEKPWRDHAIGNPCKGIERFPEYGRERFFSTRELAALSDALSRYHSAVPVNCLRLIMLTGCRPGEAMKATWDQVDTEPGYWNKPAATTKQRKNSRIPLSPAALELLNGLRRERDRDRAANRDTKWIFPGRDQGRKSKKTDGTKTHVKQINAAWMFARDTGMIALWRESDDPRVVMIVDDLTRSLGNKPVTVKLCKAEAARRKVDLPRALQGARIYDLRHTFASVGAGGGLSLHIIGRLLGHSQTKTTQRYAHLADDPLREAVDKIGTVIANAGAGGNVVDFKKDIGR